MTFVCVDGAAGSFSSQGSRMGTPSGQTPIRDGLGINMDPDVVGGSIRSTGSFSQQKEEAKAQLKAALGSLPAPKNDYEIVIPEVMNYECCISNNSISFLS